MWVENPGADNRCSHTSQRCNQHNWNAYESAYKIKLL